MAFPPRRFTIVALLIMALFGAQMGRAADPLTYEVTLAPTGDAALDGALHDASSLISLRETAPVGPFALASRAQDDAGRFAAALHSFGYYKSKVSISVAGRPLEDVGLIDMLDQAPSGLAVPVVVKLDPGPQFHIGTVAIVGDVPLDAMGQLDLPSGTPATAANVLAAQTRLLNALRASGRALAKVELQPATLRMPENLLDVHLAVNSGPAVDIGPVAVTGLQQMNEDFVRRRLLLHQGEQYSPDAIEKARQDLASLGVFSVVRVEPTDQVDLSGQLPVTFEVTERPLRSVDLGASYSTDLGVGVNAGWHHRNLFGNAEQLNLTGSIQLGGNAVQKPGYQVGVQFIKPDFLARDQSLELDLGAVKQSLQAYDQNALTQKAALNRKLSPHWLVSIGISGEQERIAQEGVSRRYNLIGLPLTAKYDSTNSLLDPTNGIRAAFSLTPMESLTGQTGTFVIMQTSASTYFDVTGNGRSVVALRGLVGQVYGAGSQFGLPPDQRFYAGGSSTVRGYRYQSIGPQFPDHNPTGGTAVSAGTVEFRQRILENFGAVAFVDAGQVTDHGAPFTRGWRVGAGVGARYYTPIGPIRLDVAVPVNRQPGGDAFELYIGIGQAF